MAKAALSRPTFGSILDTPSGEIERPKPLPTGGYVTAIQGQPRFDKSTKKGTEFVEFTLKVLEALEDVDEEALKEVGGIKDKTIKATYYLTEGAIWRLKDFLDHCGAGDDEESLRQRIDDTPGKQVIAYIRHEASEDGSSVFARLRSTASVE